MGPVHQFLGIRGWIMATGYSTPRIAGFGLLLYVPAITPVWTRSRMNPIAAIRVRLLLGQRRSEKLLDPTRFYCLQRVSLDWNSLQARCCCHQVIQRIGIVIRWNVHDPWFQVRRGQICHTGLNRHTWAGYRRSVYHWLITGACSRGVEKIPSLED